MSCTVTSKTLDGQERGSGGIVVASCKLVHQQQQKQQKQQQQAGPGGIGGGGEGARSGPSGANAHTLASDGTNQVDKKPKLADLQIKAKGKEALIDPTLDTDEEDEEGGEEEEEEEN